MKIKVSEASGPALNWMVAQCPEEWPVIIHFGKTYLKEGRRKFTCQDGTVVELWQESELWDPERNWAQGGPIIGRRQIGLDQFKGQPCRAYMGTPTQHEHAMFAPEGQPLVAAMRCHVVSFLGEEVEVPAELLLA